MSEEWFDVVNENDEVTGRQPRPVVHRLGLRHRAVHILVSDAQGKIYLQKRSRAKDCFPGVWDSSASGHVDQGETYESSAIRELGEELGLTLEAPLRALFKINACAETGMEFVWVYATITSQEPAPNPAEIETGGWFSHASIMAWVQERPADFAPAFLLVWQQFSASQRDN